MKKIDYKGRRVGRLLVIEEVPERKNSFVCWLCLCDCGNKIVRDSGYLRQVGTASCGCYTADHHKMRRRDITGQRFGKLTAIEPTDKRKQQSVIWRFQCDCGNIAEIAMKEVTAKTNPTSTCGCSKKGYIGNSEHGKKQYHNIEKNYIMGTNIELIRRKDTNPMKNNTSGYQGVSFIKTRNVWVASMRFQGSLVSKTCHSLEDAIEARKKMRAIRDEFVAWYDSLSEEEKKEAIQQYENNKIFFKTYYQNRILELNQY